MHLCLPNGDTALSILYRNLSKWYNLFHSVRFKAATSATRNRQESDKDELFIDVYLQAYNRIGQQVDWIYVVIHRSITSKYIEV